MRSLVRRAFWDTRHEMAFQAHGQEAPERAGIKRFLDHARIRLVRKPHETNSDFRMERVLRRHLPARTDWLNRLFGYQPYGVEYSLVGVQTTPAPPSRSTTSPGRT